MAKHSEECRSKKGIRGPAWLSSLGGFPHRVRSGGLPWAKCDTIAISPTHTAGREALFRHSRIGSIVRGCGAIPIEFIVMIRDRLKKIDRRVIEGVRKQKEFDRISHLNDSNCEL